MKTKNVFRGVGKVFLGIGSIVFSTTAIRIILAGVSLGCISYGVGCYYKPLAFLVPGMLVWFELIRGH